MADLRRWTGIQFPFCIDEWGRIATSTAEAEDYIHIEESIAQILNTGEGERFMRPDFGGKIKPLVFQPLDRNLEILLENILVEQVGLWEQRAALINTRNLSIPDLGILRGDIHFMIKNSKKYVTQKFEIIQG